MKTTLVLFLSIFILLVLFVYASCARRPSAREGERDWSVQRDEMIRQIIAYGVKNERVVEAMRKIWRHHFIPEKYLDLSPPYGDHPCPIGYGQTISQPYIVAYMTEKVDPRPGEKILEIGTGSGYQAAVLAEMGADVYTIEIIPELAEHARQALKAEGYGQVHVLAGDGYKGWPEHAPFDAIIVTCAPEDVPETLVDQLRDGGRMILPIGVGFQQLVILRKKGAKIEVQGDLPVAFVPMVHGK